MNAVVEEMKPLDFSILDGFEIGHGAGRYYNHRVCIMSALFLVTEIAAGRVTLEQAIKDPDEGPHFETRDSVNCVSWTLRSLAIQRNDYKPQDERSRRSWAMALMPRLVGTAYSGPRETGEENQEYERKLEEIEKLARLKENVIKAKALAQKFIAEDNLRALHRASQLVSQEAPLDLASTDRAIEAILQHLGK